MKIKVLKALAYILVLIGMLSVSTASFWVFYQPKEPKCIRKIR